MAKIHGGDMTTEALTYKTSVLKVSMHCEGCKKKVKKALQSVDGVYMTVIDSHQNKVMVTGNVDAHTLIEKLHKIKKPAELWPHYSGIQSLEWDEESGEGDENFQLGGGGGDNGGKKKKKKKKEKKKKKKKGENSNLTNKEDAGGGYAPVGTGSDPLVVVVGPTNNDPQVQQGYMYQPSYYETPVYGQSYIAAYPSTGPSHCDAVVSYDHMQLPDYTYPLPPPPDPIKIYNVRDDDYDDESRCFIM